MDYPVELLPQPKYKIIECSLEGLFLVRYTDTNSHSELIEELTGFVKSKYICSPRGNIVDLSTNLLGVFDRSFIEIELTKEGKESYSKYCAPDSEVEVPVYEVDFVLNKNRGCWYLPAESIHGLNVEYKVGNETFTAKCEVKHTPMKWNYWHFSIRWIIENENEYWHIVDKNAKKAWSKRLAHTCRGHLMKFTKLTCTEFAMIEERSYLK